MVVSVGVAGTGHAEPVEDENTFTLPGMLYRMNIVTESGVENEFDNLIASMMAVKKEYPAISITFVKVDSDKITLEFYDHPAVPLALVLIAVIAAIAVTGVAIISGTLEMLVNSIPPELRGGIVSFMLIGGTVAAAAYAISRLRR